MRPAAGFTLLEVLIAVCCFGLIAVTLSSVSLQASKVVLHTDAHLRVSLFAHELLEGRKHTQAEFAPFFASSGKQTREVYTYLWQTKLKSTMLPSISIQQLQVCAYTSLSSAPEACQEFYYR